MRLVMAVSADGYMARRRNDDMRWLGATDKAVFRILTGVGGVCAAGRNSIGVMPEALHGRLLVTLSGDPMLGSSLREFARRHPGGWLLGGPTLAAIALDRGLVDEVHLCRSSRFAFPDLTIEGAMADSVTPVLTRLGSKWRRTMATTIGDVSVERWTQT